MSASATVEHLRFVTDGGLETDLIFHHSIDLPDFAAFVLLDDPAGRRMLGDYYRGYAEVARRHGAGLRLESPTWRASADWGDRLGYTADDLERVNREAVELLHEVAADYGDLPQISLVGTIGPRGDGYRSGSWDERTGATDAEAYHRPQVEALAAAGVDTVAAYTLTDAAEAIGIVRAIRAGGAKAEVSFTVETDGRLASGRTLSDVIGDVDSAAAPDGYLLNCAHPAHLALAAPEPATAARIIGLRPNASRLSHADLDGCADLNEGDLDELAAGVAGLVEQWPAVRVIGGCCGTDVRHVERIWQLLGA